MISLSRRTLLALAPLIPFAARAAGAPPKRLLLVFTPMGYLESTFWPTGAGSTFTLGETMQALNPYKSKLLYVDGLNLYGGRWNFRSPLPDNEHGMGMGIAFTGSYKNNPMTGNSYPMGPSVDQVIADALYAQSPTSIRSLALGVNAPAPGAHGSCFFKSALTPVNPQNSPQATYDALFRNLSTAPGATEILNRRRRSVIDLVRGDLNDACARGGTSEKALCDAHLQAVRQLELGLDPPATVCVKPTAPVTGVDLKNTIHQQMDLISSAFTCDLTRVATLQLGLADGGLDMLPGINHHDTTHKCGDATTYDAGAADHKLIDKWFAERWAYLFSKLDAVQEANGTLLDNTLVLFGSDTTTMDEARGRGPHNFTRFPFWMAGGSNFAFRTGRSVRVAEGLTGTDDSYVDSNRLLVSVMQKFGLTQNTFGDIDRGSGPIAALM